MTEQPIERPTAWRWVAYAFGAGLPAAQDSWVLFDATGATWAWRHLARAMTQLAVPIAAVLLLIPGPAWIRVTMVVAGTVMGLIWSFGYMDETIDHRLEKAGYPRGLGAKLRTDRAIRQQNESSAARRAKIAERHARRS